MSKMIGIVHVLGDVPCPKCGAPSSEHEVQNYDPMRQEGDVYCEHCGAYVREYDAG
jgi:hypothetical protein